MTIVEKFLSNINKTNSCWLWLGSKNDGGYGFFRHKLMKKRSVLAHRFSYELTKGSIPSGLDINHICMVRHCVNPGHLEAVTRRKNILHAIRHKRKTVGSLAYKNLKNRKPTSLPRLRKPRAYNYVVKQPKLL